MKKKVVRFIAILVSIILLVLLIGPFLIPVPPLEGTLPPEQLAGPDSQFIKINGIQVHYQQYGEGEPGLILLHGFLSSVFTWREVALPLAERGKVVAFDRPGFGLTERPLQWQGPNPYSPDAQADLVVELMNRMGIERAILVGNSAGGSISVYTALRYPDRVQSLILVDPAIYTGGGSPAWIRPILQTPQARRLGPLLMRNVQGWGRGLGELAWHDPSKITEDVWEGYTRPLKAENWDRGLWEFTVASRPLNLPKRLAELQLPVLVITGDDDCIVPTQDSIRLASELKNAKLSVIPNCGHVPQEECPEAFMAEVNRFLDGLLSDF